jgi:hypothetical protein
LSTLCKLLNDMEEEAGSNVIGKNNDSIVG